MANFPSGIDEILDLVETIFAEMKKCKENIYKEELTQCFSKNTENKNGMDFASL